MVDYPHKRPLIQSSDSFCNTFELIVKDTVDLPVILDDSKSM